MTTPTGTITMLDVIEELDGTPTPRQITLNDTDVRALAEVPTGAISMDDLRGKSSYTPPATTVVSGKITVAAWGTYIGANRDGDGVLADIVVDPVLADSALTNMFFASNGDVNSTSWSMPADYTASINYLDIVGNGKQYTVPLPLKTWFSFNNTAVIDEPAPIIQAMFVAEDIGLTFDFYYYT